jgi:hypothetical protein
MKRYESVNVQWQELRHLKNVVAQGEGLTLEFKRKAAFPDKIVHEMIAFANTSGGLLLIGIGDDKSIAGLKHPEDERHVIREALKKCRPRLLYSETVIPISSSKWVIQYEIPESKTKPHRIETESGGVVFVRVDDKTIKASKEVKEVLRRSRIKKDIRFHFGDTEKVLMQYLDHHHSITLKKFCEISRLRKFVASRKLVLLVLANVLRIKPTEKGDLYSLSYRPPVRTE